MDRIKQEYGIKAILFNGSKLKKLKQINNNIIY